MTSYILVISHIRREFGRGATLRWDTLRQGRPKTGYSNLLLINFLALLLLHLQTQHTGNIPVTR